MSWKVGHRTASAGQTDNGHCNYAYVACARAKMVNWPSEICGSRRSAWTACLEACTLTETKIAAAHKASQTVSVSRTSCEQAATEAAAEPTESSRVHWSLAMTRHSQRMWIACPVGVALSASDGKEMKRKGVCFLIHKYIYFIARLLLLFTFGSLACEIYQRFFMLLYFLFFSFNLQFSIHFLLTSQNACSRWVHIRKFFSQPT